MSPSWRGLALVSREERAPWCASKPFSERLRRRIERAGERGITGSAVVSLEVAFELDHLAQVLSAGEGEGAVDLGGLGVVADLLPPGPG
jgi:hypothetical protein